MGFNFLPLHSFPPKPLSLQFGFKKWKSHVTARPWEDRSEIVKELYSDLNVIRGSGGGGPWGQAWLVAVWIWAAAGDNGPSWCLPSRRVHADLWQCPLPAALWMVALAPLRPRGCRDVHHHRGGSLW